MTAHVDHTVTAGTFSLDGQTFDVDNNVWVVGDEAECVVIDAPHDVAAIRRVVGDRRVLAILATHAHDDHVRVAPELARATGTPVLLHPADRVLWDMVHPDTPPDGELAEPEGLTAARRPPTGSCPDVPLTASLAAGTAPNSHGGQAVTTPIGRADPGMLLASAMQEEIQHVQLPSCPARPHRGRQRWAGGPNLTALAGCVERNRWSCRRWRR